MKKDKKQPSIAKEKTQKKKSPGRKASAVTWLRSRPAAFSNWRKEDKKKRKYRSFRLQKKIKPEPRDIPSAISLMRSSCRMIASNWRSFLILVLVYSAVYIALIRTPLATDMDDIRQLLGIVFGSESQNSIKNNLATFGLVIGSNQTSRNPTVSLLAMMVFSLIIVWFVRQLHNGKLPKVRDAIYQAMAPFISVCLVFAVLILQLIPFSVALFLYATARTNQIFISGVEDLGFFIVTAFLGLLSFYWATSSVIALYAVSLPGMYPVKALRAAKKLVKFQRFMVFRRIMTLPLMLGLIYTLILLVVIRVYPGGALIASEIMQIIMIPIANVYLYKLYRKLI